MVPARGKAVVPTGLAIAIPHGTYARIAPRSGLAVKHFVDTGAGVVDEDYRGEVGVVLFNHGDQDFQGAQAGAGRGADDKAVEWLAHRLLFRIARVCMPCAAVHVVNEAVMDTLLCELGEPVVPAS